MQFINQQIAYLKQKIVDTQASITQKQQALANASSAFQVSELNDEIQGLETKMSLLQTNFVSLVSSTESGAINTLSVLESASLPTIPIGPNKRLVIIMAALGGIVFAVGAAYLIEFLDKTLKTSEQIHRLVQFPVIGYIGNVGKSGWKHVTENPRSLVSEAFRALRTNLEFSAVDRPLKTILVTSSDAGDGKTLVAANLALILSQTEKKVVLLDCDLRKPDVHRALGIKSRPGLAEVFREHSPILDAIQKVNDQNLSVIPAGSVPPNPAELLSSKRMKQILETLSEIYDLIIIDCAPMRTTDALIMAAQVDGVVLVTRYGHTTENALQTGVEQLKRSNTRILGVILNLVPRANTFAYRYYPNAYYGRAEENPSAKLGELHGLSALRKTISNLPIIKNITHKKTKVAEINLVSDDYLFNRIVSNNTTEEAVKPTDERP
jgi:capsular exopolysaccharide synthesis family protein